MKNSLFQVAKSGLEALDGAVDVPGDDGLLASLILVDGDITQTTKLGLIIRSIDKRSGVHLLAPLKRGGELLLGGGSIVVVGPQELLEDDLGGDVRVRVAELDFPHLGVANALGDLRETSGELGERRLWSCSWGWSWRLGSGCRLNGSWSFLVDRWGGGSSSSSSLGGILFGSHDGSKFRRKGRGIYCEGRWLAEMVYSRWDGRKARARVE